jgi:hypothetical protein
VVCAHARRHRLRRDGSALYRLSTMLLLRMYHWVSIGGCVSENGSRAQQLTQPPESRSSGGNLALQVPSVYTRSVCSPLDNVPTPPLLSLILLHSACCCMIASLYMRFPGCLCCYEKTTCFCCESESVCFESANCYLVRPKVIFKTVYQVMLLDLRCAIPTDDEIPCVCMPCPFVTCCANGVGRCECCASMETLQGREA